MTTSTQLAHWHHTRRTAIHVTFVDARVAAGPRHAARSAARWRSHTTAKGPTQLGLTTTTRDAVAVRHRARFTVAQVTETAARVLTTAELFAADFAAAVKLRRRAR